MKYFNPFWRKTEPVPPPINHWNALGEQSRRLSDLQEDYDAQGKILVQLLNRVDALEEQREPKRDKYGRFAKAC